ncbi:MAG: hypothetical protein MZW92_12620 [Comamonadaceae bacterium]|nr:hypothetical protein [Comamonadaceae bacterium]
MKRGILAIGRQDAEAANLTPRDPQVRIIGGLERPPHRRSGGHPVPRRRRPFV